MDKHLEFTWNNGVLDFNNQKEMWILSTAFLQYCRFGLFPTFEDISRLYRSLKNSACLKEIYFTCSELVGDVLTAIDPQSITHFGFVHFIIVCHVENSSMNKTGKTPEDFFNVSLKS